MRQMKADIRILDRPLAFALALIAPAIAVTTILYLLPIAKLASLSVQAEPFGSSYEHLFSEFGFGRILWNTLRIGATTTIVCVLLGYPLAYLMARSSKRVSALLVVLVLLPFWTSILVRNYAWIYLLQYRGFLNNTLLSMGVIHEPLALMFNEFGVVLGMSNALLPFMVLPIFVNLRGQDRALLESAASLGAKPSAAFLRVTLPLSRNGIMTGALIVFSTSLGFYVTPALLGGGRVLVASTFISREIEETLNWENASTASVILLLIVLAIVALISKVSDSRDNHGGSVA
jgi:putative spermidine/putrescine transport system permease protein